MTRFNEYNVAEAQWYRKTCGLGREEATLAQGLLVKRLLEFSANLQMGMANRDLVGQGLGAALYPFYVNGPNPLYL